MLHTKRFNHEKDLDLFLRGALPLRPWSDKDPMPLAGHKLFFTKPDLIEVTFAPTGLASNTRVGQLTLRDLILQVQEQTLGKVVVQQSGTSVYLVDTLGKGIAMPLAVAEDTQTRNALGITTQAFSTSPIYPINSGRAPRLVSIQSDETSIRVFWEDTLEGSLGPSTEVLFLNDPSSMGSPLVLLQTSRKIYVGGTGNVVVHLLKSPPGVFTTYTGVPAGTYMTLAVDVISNDTTATNLVVEY